MAKRYKIWDRQEEIYCQGMDKSLAGLTYSTPGGTARFTAEEWLMLHPAPPAAKIVLSAGDYNGGFCMTLGAMRAVYEANGADFSACGDDQAVLDAIEAWEDEQNAAAQQAAEKEAARLAEDTAARVRAANAAELANVLTMAVNFPQNEDDPDE